MKRIIFLAIIVFSTTNFGCRSDREDRVESVILLIGDGMGLAQITALSIENEYIPLNIERAEYVGIQKTYSANNQITDSAASGTAIATGEKTNNGMIGVSPNGEALESSLRVAQQMGKATALITTCPPIDATPAAFYAHNKSRRAKEDIASQLVESGVDVIAGSGRAFFNKRKDGRDLINDFVDIGYTFAGDVGTFLSTSSTPVIMLTDDYVMPYVVYDSLSVRNNYLALATAKTLDLMKLTGKDGFFMMVEGSLIDYAGHDNDIKELLGEMRDFDNAVKVAMDYADSHPGTLVVVTGDHETGGLTIISDSKDFTAADSKVDYNFSTKMHSGTFLPVFAYGAGAKNFAGVMENTDIAIKIKHLLKREN